MADKRRADKLTQDREHIVFVGGLRKSTTEDKVMGHFSKYGQIDNVDIKRLPDGTSRGFAFVKFVDKDSVEKVCEARASHMIDNKWVAVRPHGGSQPGETQGEERIMMKRPKKEATQDTEDSTGGDYAEKFSENYLAEAAKLGSQRDGDSSKNQGDSEETNALDSNPMMANMMKMMQMQQGMMNPMMMQQMQMMMNPMMMQQMSMMQPGMMQPGMMQPGMMQPMMMQPGMMQPGMMQPGMMQPGMMQPGMMQPGMVQPGMMQPGMTQPGMTQPALMQGSVQPGTALPAAPQPEITPGPTAPQPDAAQQEGAATTD